MSSNQATMEEFEWWNLDLSYILALKSIAATQGISVSQKKYANEILEKFNMAMQSYKHMMQQVWNF